jgi:hypothetical protein
VNHAFAERGYHLLEALLSTADLEAASSALASTPLAGAGSREVLQLPFCQALSQRLLESPALTGCLPAGHQPIQCTYFEKSTAKNWLVPLHQDLSVPVAARPAETQLKGWAQKEGRWYVQPPANLLEQLVAVRIHLDACGLQDGPLRVVPGSHRLGVLTDTQARQARDSLGEVVCPVEQGGAMVMRPLLLHASSKATGHSRRRVLHFLFGPADPPTARRSSNIGR